MSTWTHADQNANKFRKTFCHFGLLQHVNEPMYIKGHNLDLAIMHNDCNVKNIYIYPSKISDHVSLHNAINEEPNLDPSDVSCYWPISNCPMLSKLFERMVAAQLVDYLNAKNLMSNLESAHHENHSTETALAKVLQVLDTGN